MAERLPTSTGFAAREGKTNGQVLSKLPKAVLLRKRTEIRKLANQKRKERAEKLNAEVCEVTLALEQKSDPKNLTLTGQ